ncbi:hemolysin XhlA family protein [Oceaniglobus trochenteri]|uniref:hemolysin XhlA family protein n=1 Tax=Oceaniglobus trochenteri TaxID=2763260 RepID=UPI001CFFE02E
MDDLWRQTVEARLFASETRDAVDEVHRLNVEKRLTAIEDSLRWLVRLIVGGMVMGALAFALKGGFAPL